MLWQIPWHWTSWNRHFHATILIFNYSEQYNRSPLHIKYITLIPFILLSFSPKTTIRTKKKLGHRSERSLLGTMALNVALPLSADELFEENENDMQYSVDHCRENLKILVSPGSESSGVSSLDAEEAKVSSAQVKSTDHCVQNILILILVVLCRN